MICEHMHDGSNSQIIGREYWMQRRDHAIAQLRRTENRTLAAVYQKLADHYQALATLCGEFTGRTSRIDTTLAV